MRYADLLEKKSGTVRPGVKHVMSPTFVMPKLQNNDAYVQYRHSVALASARAAEEQEFGIDAMTASSAWGENLAVVCYTPEEEVTLNMANKIMNVGKDPLTYTPSQESPLVQKISPVRPFVDITETELFRNLINLVENKNKSSKYSVIHYDGPTNVSSKILNQTNIVSSSKKELLEKISIWMKSIGLDPADEDDINTISYTLVA